ncbi:DUF2231 domain-containing protein [Mycolicibacterium confluentis]|uniref:DUF2231 domain-containing protein n=1 Tax=Mycolicibacterium confluentis TaxID=28047 RepID=A0A7I7XVR5_9MYCO|nr:DUF2231 domain-containing protein [Mycolicibacterium confluentis]MCV7321592.1 hypothetical protein [Mycolicibacterium confluentis]ORV26702.1 hypothetical protein AWB99_20955 [Mycolicibacterium confluentis]BBZ33400.1 hypothetical protein MCNF_20050 [Mycolicibacterium confluentis]
MSTVNGLPGHVLLVHFLVVLTPLTAVLAILCALWPAALRHLIWLVLALAVTCLALTPFTTEAGEWLEGRVDPSPLVTTHAALGDTMIYVTAALVVAALLLLLKHVRTARSAALPQSVVAVITVLVLLIGAGAVVQVYRIGDSGAQSAWADAVSGE